MIFSATPSPSGGKLLQPPSTLISGMTSLDENFYHNFVVLAFSWVNWRLAFKVLNVKTLKEKNKSGGGGGLQQPPH